MVVSLLLLSLFRGRHWAIGRRGRRLKTNSKIVDLGWNGDRRSGLLLLLLNKLLPEPKPSDTNGEYPLRGLCGGVRVDTELLLIPILSQPNKLVLLAVLPLPERLLVSLALGARVEPCANSVVVASHAECLGEVRPCVRCACEHERVDVAPLVRLD